MRFTIAARRLTSSLCVGSILAISASAMAADTAEKAAHALSMAKNYIAAQRYDLARARLQKLVEQYPGTRAADESKALLKEIAGK